MIDLAPAASRLIAVVEDDRAVLNSLEFALEAEGYVVLAFGKATDAKDSLDVLNADCLVVDYAMPDLSGVELLKELRDRGLSCPAIVIASNPKLRCRQEVRAADAPLIEKPLMGRDLVDQISKALAGASA